MILGFLFFIQTFLKHCKALSTEKDRRYRQIFIIIINNSKLNETKDQFRIRSTKRSNTEPVMAPEITHVTDFQRPYICLFEYTTSKFTLVSRRVIFSKPEKIITHLKFSRIQRLLWRSADLSLLCGDARHLSLFHMFLWWSFTNNAWSHGIWKATK